jgi:biotin carboxyl carrier protein
MKFQFDIADRERTVDVQRQADGFLVTVDGHPRRVDAVRVDPETWSLLVHDADGTPSSVEAVVVAQNGDGTMHVYVGGRCVTVETRGGLGRRSRDRAGTSGAGPQRVTAPMPGKVLKVLVKSGDDVQPRQGLVVVEAMKMENELRASRAGRVREVFVSEGQSVEAGTALIVVE